uniref:Uncharacterized protein n=1 Tax=Utricularia reniformis TaxID=192314 RepID=A0A1Y0B2R9_9LAMI|nr:hypothetical protein AEK19_MT1555 [Utricularia reniformis]ART31742.1 hypothetical protein AEK19_MT1555 [Utricularia reniformis]
MLSNAHPVSDYATFATALTLLAMRIPMLLFYSISIYLIE